MGGNQSSAGKKHIYEEITDAHTKVGRTASGRRESTATLDVRVEDLAEMGRMRYGQANVEWGEDVAEGLDRHRGGWCQEQGWAHEDVRKTRTRKRAAISNVTFYENVDNIIYGEDNIPAADYDDSEGDEFKEVQTVKYKRCRSIDIKVLDSKEGENIEF